MDRSGEAGMVELGRNGPQASGQGPQALAPGQLGKGPGAELLGAVQAPHAEIAIVASNDPENRGVPESFDRKPAEIEPARTRPGEFKPRTPAISRK